jgi:molybdenum cofactor guanylyltransferase
MSVGVIGVILAGGRGARLGGGKPLRALAGRPMIAHVIDCLRPQTDALLIAASGPDAALANFGCPLVHDQEPGQPGPLAGILAALEWAGVNAPDARFLVSAPCDTPLLPIDLVAKLRAAAAPDIDVVCATSRGRAHFTVGLWRLGLVETLRAIAWRDQVRRMETAISRLRRADIDFDNPAHDPFDNANTPEDLVRIERLLRDRS